jgi:uncharacterized protein YegP (UPF0339 family)
MGLLDILKFVTMHFELFIGKDDEHYFRLVNAHGDTALFSEGYKSKAGALNGIESVRRNGTNLEQYQIRDNSFTLKASNGQNIAQSPQFASKERTDKILREIVENVSDADVSEL